MSKRVYLHIGEPKCGTTFLQQVMWASRDELAAHGVVLPGLSIEDHFRAMQDLRHAYQPDNDPSGSWSGEWKALTRQALGGDNVAIISHEMLAGVPAEHAERAVRSLQSAEVHVVVTVRDIASLLPAEWQETVKHQNRQTWSRWLYFVTQRARRAANASRGSGRCTTPSNCCVAGVRCCRPRTCTSSPSRRRGRSRTCCGSGSRRSSVCRRTRSTRRGRVPTRRSGSPRSRCCAISTSGCAATTTLPQWFYAGHVKETLAHQVLAARPKKNRLVLPQKYEEWADEVAEKQIVGLRTAGYDIVGDLDELRPRPIGDGPRPRPKDVPYKELYDASLDALAGLLHERYEAVTARPSLRSLFTGSPTQFPGAYRVRRALRDMAAKHASVAGLRMLVWRVLSRARRRRGKG